MRHKCRGKVLNCGNVRKASQPVRAARTGVARCPQLMTRLAVHGESSVRSSLCRCLGRSKGVTCTDVQVSDLWALTGGQR